MAMPEYVERDLPPGELLPGRDLLDPGLFCHAALKAANRGHTDIKLLGAVAGGQAQERAGRMPDKIWKPIVKKVGMEKLEEL
jgi:hypothetical protein